MRMKSPDQLFTAEARGKARARDHAIGHAKPGLERLGKLIPLCHDSVDGGAETVGPGLGVALGEHELGRRVTLCQFAEE